MALIGRFGSNSICNPGSLQNKPVSTISYKLLCSKGFGWEGTDCPGLSVLWVFSFRRLKTSDVHLTNANSLQ